MAVREIQLKQVDYRPSAGGYEVVSGELVGLRGLHPATLS